jgi:ATP-dependent DNA helicase RecG
MDFEQLRELVRQGESERLEFKKSTGQRSRIAETVCGMANALGSDVLVGVNDACSIVGQSIGTKSLEDLHRELAEIEPALYPTVETIPLAGDDMKVIRVSVLRSDLAPHVYRGRPYRRVGSANLVMPQEAYRRLLLERVHSSTRWENQSSHLTIADVDDDEVARLVSDGIAQGRLGRPESNETDDLLRGLGLLGGDGRPVNACLVLFGRREALQRTHLQCMLRMARFRGVEKHEASDSRQVAANAFELFRLGQEFLLDHLPVAGRVVPELFRRVDTPLYPLEALREALANALCHRDYSTGAGSVDIAMFDDRLEIVSDGGLHFGLTVDDLYLPHESKPWNPIIAEVFHKRGIIDRWGTGTLKIVRLVEEAGLARPEFEERAGSLVVRFLPSGYVPPSRIDHDLSPLQQELLAVIAERGPSSLSSIIGDLAQPTPRRTVQDNLILLRTLGLVASGGRGQGARWRLEPPM